MPINRGIPIDMDDDIIIIPNFTNRRVNSLLVMPF